MSRITVIRFGVLVTLLLACGAGSTLDAGTEAVLREDLRRVRLSDGSLLGLTVIVESLDRPSRSLHGVYVARYPPGSDPNAKGPVLWGDYVAPFEHRPDFKAHYALAKEVGDHVIVVFLWDSSYCVLSLADGRIVERGHGVDVLRRHDEWAPLQLNIVLPSTLESLPPATAPSAE